jgi:hypothetical protein
MPEEKLNYNTINEGVTVGATQTVNSNNLIVYSGTSSVHSIISDNTNITIGNTDLFDSNSTYGSFSFSGYFSCFKITDNLILKEEESNFLIIPKNNLVISWSDKDKTFIENDLNEFIHDLKNDNFSEKAFENKTDKFNQIFSLLIKMDGNLYIDLKEKSYYRYSSKNKSWVKMFGEIKSLIFSRKSNLKSVKENKNERFLMIEKPFKFKLNFHKGNSTLDSGYVYVPYVPLTYTATNIVNGTDNSIVTNTAINSRYSTVTINGNYYNTITL